MWRVVAICLSLSIGMVLWLGYEVGVVFPNRVEAAEAVSASKKAAPAATSIVDQAAQDRIKALDQRAEALDRREQLLNERDKILSGRVEGYERVISEYKAKLVEMEAAKSAKVETTQQIYQKMDPKKAAKVLEQMDVALSSQIIGGMKGERAAEIFGQMAPDRAREITERYLGKRGLASKVNEVKAKKEEGAQAPQGGGE